MPSVIIQSDVRTRTQRLEFTCSAAALDAVLIALADGQAEAKSDEGRRLLREFAS